MKSKRRPLSAPWPRHSIRGIFTPILRPGRSIGAGSMGMGRELQPEGVTIEPLETVTDVMERDGESSPILEVEELRGLVALGRERGYLTFEQIAATLEEVE